MASKNGGWQDKLCLVRYRWVFLILTVTNGPRKLFAYAMWPATLLCTPICLTKIQNEHFNANLSTDMPTLANTLEPNRFAATVDSLKHHLPSYE